MGPRSAERDVNIGGFRIFRAQGKITRRGRTLAVSPKAIQVLSCLIDAGTRGVARDAFIARVWDDNYVVGDHGLRDAIWELRKAFGDDPRTPRFIQTIPRKGYRLLVEPRAAHRARPWFRRGLLTVAVALVGFAAWTVSLNGSDPLDSGASRPEWFGPAPVVAGNRQRLALIRNVNGQSDLFVVSGSFDDFGSSFLDAPHGVPANAQQVTNSKAGKISPVWAPNHVDLAFIEHDPSTSACSVRVYLARQGQVKTLARDCYLVISPIGQVPAQLSWSADGERLAYQSRTGTDSAAIAMVRVDNPGLPVTLTDPRGDIDAFPRWSGSGELAFLRLKDPMVAMGEIMVLNDRAAPMLRCESAPVWGLAWVDDRHIAVVAALGNPFALWVYDSETGATAATGLAARYLQSVPVGDALIVDRFLLDTPLQQSSLLGESPPINIDIEGGPLAVDHSSASGALAVTFVRSEQMHLALQSPQGQRQVVYSAREIYRPRFSVDGRWLGFSARNSTAENVVAYGRDARTGRVRRLSSPDRAVFFSQWAAQGDSYYGLRGVPAPLGRGASLVRMDLAGRVLETLGEAVSWNVVIDHDAGVWWSDDRGVIYRRAATGGQPVAMYQLKSAYESWTVEKATQTLYVSATHLDGTEILALDHPPTAPQVVKSLASHIDPIVGLTIGPDRSLMYRRSAFSWRQRRPLSIDHLLRTTENSPRSRHRCQRQDEIALAVGNHSR